MNATAHAGPIQVVQGGRFVVGQRSEYMRRWVSVDTSLKSVTNRSWARLSARARAAHYEMEIWCGRNLTGGRVPGAGLFNRSDWRIFMTSRPTIDELVQTGWARWEGDNLALAGTDVGGRKKVRGPGRSEEPKGRAPVGPGQKKAARALRAVHIDEGPPDHRSALRD